MVILDKNKCIGCGQCAIICHHKCIRLRDIDGDEYPVIDPNYCSTCTQCIAVCLQKALSWNGRNPVAFDDSNLPTADNLEELLKQRRTIRKFRKTKIDREQLEEIICFGVYAPTNNFHLRVLLIDSVKVFNAIDKWVMEDISRIYHLIYRPKPIFNLLKMFFPTVNIVMKEKLKRGLEFGTSFDTLPAAVVLIVGDKRIMLSEASAQFAAYNMILMGQTRGWGSRMIGAAPTTMNKNQKIRKLLKLSPHEQILSGFELGIPAMSFNNKVEGKKFDINYIEEVYAE